ncbi:11261_t:CDS:2, partial [Acaulospora morrowiae]
MLADIPNELIIHILDIVLKETSFKKICQLMRTCKQWKKLIPIVIKDEISKNFTSGWMIEDISLHNIDSRAFSHKFGLKSGLSFLDYSPSLNTFYFMRVISKRDIGFVSSSSHAKYYLYLYYSIYNFQ